MPRCGILRCACTSSSSNRVSAADKERFYEETKLFALLFGIPEKCIAAELGRIRRLQRAHVGQRTTRRIAGDRWRSCDFLFTPLLPGLGPAMRWMEMVTAATLPPRLRDAFELEYSAQRRHRYERAVSRMRRLQRLLPDRLRYSPTYFEALARIGGRRSDALTRLATRATLGRWRLVS